VTTLAIPPINDEKPIHAGGSEVADCQDGKQLQQFPIMASQEINFGLSFEAADINFDGYLDFSVLTEYAGGWTARAYWVYNPGSQRFVKNDLTNALEVKLKGYVIGFDPQNRQISAGILAAYTACAGTEPDVYEVRNNRLALINKVEILPGANRGVCVKQVWEIAGGTLRVTSEQCVDVQGNPVDPNYVRPLDEPSQQKPPLAPSEPPPAPGALLFERPLDSSQEGLYSSGEGRQVGADQFIFPNGATVTGLRWYGYRRCFGDPGASQAFEVAFFLDRNGLPSGEPFATVQVEARINPTSYSVSVGNNNQVFLYSASLASPIAVPVGQRTWLMIRQGFAHCSFFVGPQRFWRRRNRRVGRGGWHGSNSLL
jgi:hypothetical protein